MSSPARRPFSHGVFISPFACGRGLEPSVACSAARPSSLNDFSEGPERPNRASVRFTGLFLFRLAFSCLVREAFVCDDSSLCFSCKRQFRHSNCSARQPVCCPGRGAVSRAAVSHSVPHCPGVPCPESGRPWTRPFVGLLVSDARRLLCLRFIAHVEGRSPCLALNVAWVVPRSAGSHLTSL